MSDLADRLRKWANLLRDMTIHHGAAKALDEAATEVDRLRAALRKIEAWDGGPTNLGSNGSRDHFRNIASDALYFEYDHPSATHQP